jgi:ribosomal protein S6
LNTLYEGLFIFPETLDEEGLDQSIARVKEELEKLGGTLESTTRMGK